MSPYLLQVLVAFLLGYINTKTGLESPKVDFRAQLSSFNVIQILVRNKKKYSLHCLAGFKSKCTESRNNLFYPFLIFFSTYFILLYFSPFGNILGFLFTTRNIFLFPFLLHFLLVATLFRCQGVDEQHSLIRKP